MAVGQVEREFGKHVRQVISDKMWKHLIRAEAAMIVLMQDQDKYADAQELIRRVISASEDC